MSNLNEKAYDTVLKMLYPNGDLRIGNAGTSLETQLEHLRIDCEAIMNGHVPLDHLVTTTGDLRSVNGTLARILDASEELARLITELLREHS